MNKAHIFKRIFSLWSTILLGAAAIMLVFAVVSSPETAFQSSLQALKLWWNIVFPALLPFLVLVEIINAYGWAQGIGVLMEPLMRKVFRLPGKGGSVLITGMIAGFPAGAQVSATMVEQGELDAKDAGKLAALSHFCNPMTILIVIGSGLLHQPAAGYFLLAIHWISGLLAAWTYSARRVTLKRKMSLQSEYATKHKEQNKNASLLLQAARAASEARTRDGRSFGKLLGESVSRSVQTLMMTGGFIMIFSVIVNAISSYLLPNAPSYAPASLFEFHLGAQRISESSFVSPTLQLAILSAVLAWSGVSAHLQTLSGLKTNSGLKWTVFAFKRLIHAAYAFGLTIVLWEPASSITSSVLPAFGAVPQETLQNEHSFSLWSGFYNLFQWQIVTSIVLIGLFLTISRFIGRLSR